MLPDVFLVQNNKFHNGSEAILGPPVTDEWKLISRSIW